MFVSRKTALPVVRAINVFAAETHRLISQANVNSVFSTSPSGARNDSAALVGLLLASSPVVNETATLDRPREQKDEATKSLLTAAHDERTIDINMAVIRTKTKSGGDCVVTVWPLYFALMYRGAL